MIATTRLFAIPIPFIIFISTISCGNISSSSQDSLELQPPPTSNQDIATKPVGDSESIEKGQNNSKKSSTKNENRTTSTDRAPGIETKNLNEKTPVSVNSNFLPDSNSIASLASERQVITRTIDIKAEVSDVRTSIEQIKEVASSLGGWVVGWNLDSKQNGFISFRVPTNQLDKSIHKINDLVLKIQSEISSREDITDNYIDLQGRLTNLKATESALLNLLNKAETIEQTLQIQKTLMVVKEDSEKVIGKVKHREQSAAYSLVNITIIKSPSTMFADAGPDQKVRINEPVQFRAAFKAPKSVEDFSFTWDFGDGSPIVKSNIIAPTESEDTSVTATINHVYSSELNSPYIVKFNIQGFGEDGRSEGTDITKIHVVRIPEIEVFSNDSLSIEAGQTLEFSGSFTRPTNFTNVQFIWDFGDGSDLLNGSLDHGISTTMTRHIYYNHRSFPFVAKLTIIGQTENGLARGFTTINVSVLEPDKWIVDSLNVNQQIKTAFRTLSELGKLILASAIWVLIFSPVILILGGGTVFLKKKIDSNRVSRK